ncbi:Cytochrome P450 71C4 [Hordeum vulgare]|nr:Cytochrome P450 71C4 [Hordeum vulgare]
MRLFSGAGNSKAKGKSPAIFFSLGVPLAFAGSNKAKGKSPAIPFSSKFLSPSPAPTRQPRQRVNMPVHQAEWHWQHRVPLLYPDATLPHDWHLDPERIPVLAMPRSARVHAEEVRRRRALLTSDSFSLAFLS